MGNRLGGNRRLGRLRCGGGRRRFGLGWKDWIADRSCDFRRFLVYGTGREGQCEENPKGKAPFVVWHVVSCGIANLIFIVYLEINNTSSISTIFDLLMRIFFVLQLLLDFYFQSQSPDSFSENFLKVLGCITKKPLLLTKRKKFGHFSKNKRCVKSICKKLSEFIVREKIFQNFIIFSILEGSL
jgi:hypothetical protein